MGHDAEAIEHYVMDRALQQPLEPLLRRYHKGLQLQRRASLGADTTLRELTEFVLVSPCHGHDAHKALYHSLMRELGDATVMKDCHITTQALRNNF